MKIELDNEAVDGIVRSILIRDYKMLKLDIIRLKERKDSLKPYQREDLQANKKYKKAMETLLEYYVGINWKQGLREYEPYTNIPDEL